MNTSEFIQKYNGKKIDWDNAYLGQCVDLFRQYCHDVLNISQPKGVVGAADFWTNYATDSVLNTNFTQIPNDASFKPQEGDVMIWNKKAGGGFGHVGVVSDSSATLKNFNSFDQNWFKISVCEVVKHTYTNVYGVLRPKVKPMNEPTMVTQADWQTERDERNKNWGLYQEQLQQNGELTQETAIVRKQLEDEKRLHLIDLESIAVELNVSADMAKIIPAIKTCIGFEDENTKLKKERAEDIELYEGKLNAFEKKQVALQKALDDANAELAILRNEKPESVITSGSQSIFERIIHIFTKGS